MAEGSSPSHGRPCGLVRSDGLSPDPFSRQALGARDLSFAYH